MDPQVADILARGYWSSGVFHCPPPRSRRQHPRHNAAMVRVDGQYATEEEAVAAAQAVIDHGRPNIGTFIHKPTARPSVSFNLAPDDLQALGRMRDKVMKEP